MINAHRRTLLHATSLAAVLASIGLAMPSYVAAQARRNGTAFSAKSLEEALKAVAGNVVDSNDIALTVLDINEDGAKVPVTVASNIPGTQEIYIFVDKNVNPLSASFMFEAGTEPFVNTYVKMAQSSMVVAVVKAQGKFYSASKQTKVTLGGCAA